MNIPEVNIPDVLNSPLTFGIEFEPAKVQYETFDKKYLVDGSKIDRKASITLEHTLAHTYFNKFEDSDRICMSNIEFVLGVFGYDNTKKFLSDDIYHRDEIYEEIVDDIMTLIKTGDFEKLRIFKELNPEDMDAPAGIFPKNKNSYIKCEFNDENKISSIYEKYKNNDRDVIEMLKNHPIKFVYEPIGSGNLENVEKLIQEHEGMTQITIGTNYAYLQPIFQKYSYLDLFNKSLIDLSIYTKSIDSSIKHKDLYIYEIFKGFILMIIYVCIKYETQRIKNAIEGPKTYFKAMVLKPRSDLYVSLLQLKRYYGEKTIENMFNLFKNSLEKRMELLYYTNIEEEEGKGITKTPINKEELSLLHDIFLSNGDNAKARLYNQLFFRFKKDIVCNGKNLSDVYNKYMWLTNERKAFAAKKYLDQYIQLLDNCIIVDMYYILLCLENPVKCIYISSFGNIDIHKPGFYISKLEDHSVFDQYGIERFETHHSCLFQEIPSIEDILIDGTIKLSSPPLELFELYNSDSNCIIEFRAPYGFIDPGSLVRHYTLSALNDELLNPFFNVLKEEYKKYLISLIKRNERHI